MHEFANFWIGMTPLKKFFFFSVFLSLLFLKKRRRWISTLLVEIAVFLSNTLLTVISFELMFLQEQGLHKFEEK